MITRKYGIALFLLYIYMLSMQTTYASSGVIEHCFERYYNISEKPNQQTNRITLHLLENSNSDDVMLELYFSIKNHPELWSLSGLCKVDAFGKFMCILDSDAGKIDLTIKQNVAFINTNGYISGEVWRKDDEMFEFYHLTGKDDTIFKLFRVPENNCLSAKDALE